MEWDRDDVNGVLWVASEGAHSLCGSMEGPCGTRFTRHFTYVRDRDFTWCLPEEELRRVGRHLVGKEARDFAERELAFDAAGVTELRGMSAAPGRARGTVRIVQGLRDLRKMRRGDVLVASMTRPESVPAMRLAVAIVTDEGGVTCHAAIVSRELGVPCVIGTKHASRALQDGDLVEVDADQGIVRLLERRRN